MNINYFTVSDRIDLGNGFVVLLLAHEYGSGPEVRLPVMGRTEDFPIGKRVEVSVALSD